MQPWLVRGVAMAVVNAAAQTMIAKLEVTHPTSTSVLEPLTLAVLVGVALLWGGLDGWLRWAGSRPVMAWFYAGLFGGLLAGLLGVIGQAVFVDQTGIWALSTALTGGAAFTALLIMIPGALGLLVGSRLAAPAQASADSSGPSSGPSGGSSAKSGAKSDDTEATMVMDKLVIDERPKPNPLPRRKPSPAPRGFSAGR